jgi:hypothetical protein
MWTNVAPPSRRNTMSPDPIVSASGDPASIRDGTCDTWSRPTLVAETRRPPDQVRKGELAPQTGFELASHRQVTRTPSITDHALRHRATNRVNALRRCRIGPTRRT